MIEILKNEQDFLSFHQNNQDKKIGLVPTMGNLHQGHLSLLEVSLRENDLSIISIYVNPTQFAPNEDLDSYPRTLKKDLIKIKEILNKFPGKEVYVFHPESNEVIYPKDFKDFITITSLNKVIEGEVRPTHFDGVATVVKRLFSIVKPTAAYFGKKDYQQLRLIEELVRQENLNIQVIGLPIIRETDGLAMSSRNLYLDEKQRQDALILNKKLKEVAKELSSKGLNSAMNLLKEIKNTDKRFNYLEIRKQNDLKPPVDSDRDLVLLGNLQIGTTRLLDNIEVNL